jgi:hypothetical protein
MDRTSTEERYEFQLRTGFISNYLSRAIRPHRFVTDGTFNMISVALVTDNPAPARLVPLDCLQVQLTYDRSEYEAARSAKNFEYYLGLFEQGFRRAAEFKEIPLDTLLLLLEQFRAGGYKNEWRHKKKLFREQDVSVALDCYFTTDDFRLVATFEQISTKKELRRCVVMKTDPDEVCFQGHFKDILMDANQFIITDEGNLPRFLIDIESGACKIKSL